MGVNTILNTVSATLAQQSTPVSIRQSASTASLSSPALSQQGQAAAVTSPSQSLVQSASLVNASAGVAQLGTLLQVAQSGTEQVSTILRQLQNIAQQATQDGGDVTGLDSAFQDLLNQIESTVSGTKFGGSGVIDGTLSNTGNSTATAETDGQSLQLPDLSASGLFGGSSLDVFTPENAQSALSVLAGAQDQVSATGNDIADALSQVNFASATIDTALSNSTAATSLLTENDFTGGETEDLASGFLSKPDVSSQVQTANLPQSLLSLIQE